ncbi:amidohydrolase family protein [Microbulbifer sp. CNSA002]|uniref:N-acyl-D-amino-acid deacylase family protein n=1 Tax=Microbulbifer sp. CNSA002 TaxID=3373604 RepID=UPI0039B5462E
MKFTQSLLVKYCLVLLFLFYSAVTLAQNNKIDYLDILILDGKVIDGSGNPWIKQDVGVVDDKIVFVGNADSLRSKAKLTINAEGLYVTPGFIDMHSHADLNDPQGKKMLPQIFQGVTSVIIGVDGFGKNDVLEQYKVAEEGGERLSDTGVNIGTYVGFNQARLNVMGMNDRPASNEERSKTTQYLESGIQQGAFGVSTGLFYRPASYASTKEVIESLSFLNKYKAIYDTHDRDLGAVLNGIGYDASVAEAIKIGSAIDARIIFSHFTPQGKHNDGRANVGIDLINNARADGAQVFAAQHPYTATQSSLLAYTIPDWALAGGMTSLLERLQSKNLLNRLHSEHRQMLDIRGGPEKLLFTDNNKDLNGKTLAQVSKELNLSTLDTVLHIAKEQRDASVMNLELYDMDNIRLLATQEWMMTSSDGGSHAVPGQRAHPRTFGAFAKKIRQFVVDESLISLPFLIRGMTALPASFLGIQDRGRLAPGYYADIAIFDLDQVNDRATYQDPQQLAEGFIHVLVNGELALYHGEIKSTDLGQVLLRHQPLVNEMPTALQVKENLLGAFGGKDLLHKIESLTSTIELSSESKPSRTKIQYLNFLNESIAEYSGRENVIHFGVEGQYELYQGGNSIDPESAAYISLNKKDNLLQGLWLNFLYFLRDPSMEVQGPFDVPEHRSESWWKLVSGGRITPLLGIDPDTGYIRKVLYKNGVYVEEFDYRRIEPGVVWPHQFKVINNGKVSLSGRYSTLKVNSDSGFVELPSWFPEN